MHFASNQAKTTDDVNALSFIKHLNVQGMPTANIADSLWLINMMAVYLFDDPNILENVNLVL